MIRADVQNAFLHRSFCMEFSAAQCPRVRLSRLQRSLARPPAQALHPIILPEHFRPVVLIRRSGPTIHSASAFSSGPDDLTDHSLNGLRRADRRNWQDAVHRAAHSGNNSEFNSGPSMRRCRTGRHERRHQFSPSLFRQSFSFGRHTSPAGPWAVLISLIINYPASSPKALDELTGGNKGAGG